MRRCLRGQRRTDLAAGDHSRAPGDRRARARGAGADVGARHVGLRRPARGRGARGAHPGRRRSPARGARADGRRPEAGAIRPGDAHRVAGHAPPPADRRAARRAGGGAGAARRAPADERERRDDRTSTGQPPHLRQPSPPPQLPALLQRPDRVRQRHLDAEHRRRVGRPRADALAGCGGRAGALPVPAVHGARAVRGRAGRPVRRAAHGDRDPGLGDGAGRDPGGAGGRRAMSPPTRCTC